MIQLLNARFWQEGHFVGGSIFIDQDRIVTALPNPAASVPEAMQVDLKGAFVYPGFIDTHTHAFEGGLYTMGADLSQVKLLSDVLGVIKEACAQSNAEDIIFAWQFDENGIMEKRFPTLAELDSVCSNRPLVLRRIDGHSSMLNSYARNKLPHKLLTGEILRGADNDHAVHFFHSQVSEAQIIDAYHRAADIALKAGFTGLHTMIGDAEYSITHYQLIRDRLGSFPIEYTLYPQSFNLKAALDAGATRIGGCILADGSIGSHTAALSEPYIGSDSKGTLYHNSSFWDDFIGRAHRHNLQVGVHCIGDQAASQINRVYLSLAESYPKDLRHQLIHCEITDNNLISRIEASKAVPVMQPNFDLLWGGDQGFYANNLGLERSRIMNRFATMMNSGIQVCGSSDWYITPLDAVASIRAAMQHHNPSERLSHAQSVDIYTANAAWLSHDEHRRGKIEPGFQADLSILSHAIDDFGNKPLVKMIIHAGKVVYEAK